MKTKIILATLIVLSLFISKNVFADTIYQTLKPGQVNAEVKTLQRILNNIGKSVTTIGQETSFFGPRTVSAIRSMQCEYNIVCSGPTWGLVGPQTKALLSRLQSEGRVLDGATGPTPAFQYLFENNANDSIGGNNLATFGAPTYAVGKSGQAIKLNGISQYAEKDTSGITGYPFSFAAWVNGAGTVVSLSDKAANVGYYTLDFNGDKAVLNFRPDVGFANTSIASKSVGGGWHHVVGVFASDTDKKLYVDGVLEANSTISKKFISTSNRISIGRVGRSNEGGYFSGLIDDVNIYTRVLSCEEIKQLSGSSVSCGGTTTPPPTGSTATTTPSNPAPSNPTPSNPSPSNPNPATTTSNTIPSGVVTVKQDGTGNFKTISECTALAKAGNTCLVYPGVYNETVIVADSGTAQNPIILKAVNPWTKGATSNLSVIKGNVSVKSGVHIEGFELHGGKFAVNGSNVSIIGNYVHGDENFAPYDGVSIIRAKPYHSNVTVKNNRFYMLSHGMGIFCSDNCLVENNEIERMYTIERCRLQVSGCGGDVDAIRVFGNGITIRNNKIFGSKLSEMYENAHVDGIQSFTNGGLGGQGYDTLTNTVIENNYITDVHQAIWMTTGNCSFNGVPMSNYNITFRNNILNNGTGFGAARSAIGGTCADNVQVYNNTFLQTARISATNKAIIKNNIFDSNALLDGDKFTWPQKQYEFTNNILTVSGWLNKDTIKKTGISATNKYLADKAGLFSPGSVSLMAGSPAIDFGISLASTGFSKDTAGTDRPQGAAWDAGAYEWYSGQPVINPPQPQNPSNPNPTVPLATTTPSTNPTITDSDSDGVPDTLDRCPATPISLKTLVNNYGCPKPLMTTLDIKPDITNLDLSKIPVLELGRTNVGKIRWNSEVSLTRATAQLDLDTNLKIERNKVTLNSTTTPELNKPATITLYNITETNPKILKNGVECTQPHCVINSFTNGTLVFTVTGFSTYEVVSGTIPPVITPTTTPATTPTQGDPTPQPISGGGGGSSSGGSTTIYYGNQSNTQVSCLEGQLFNTQTGQRCTSNSQSQSQNSNPAFKRNLTVGSRGDDVKQLQDFLVQGGYLNLNGEPTTTYFGNLTRLALIKYQQAQGISPAAGYFGPLTISSIQGQNPTYTPPTTTNTDSQTSTTFTRNLTIGSRGADVSALQTILVSGGYLGAENVSGYFGPLTRSALIKYQQANNISPAEGYFGAVTRGVMGR